MEQMPSLNLMHYNIFIYKLFIVQYRKSKLAAQL